MGDEQLVTIGLDAGTGGIRVLAMDLSGRVVAVGRADLPSNCKRSDGVFAEQDPHAWTTAAQTALRNATAVLPEKSKIIGIGVDATSGTFLLADAEHRPLGPALMYNDLRATAAQVHRAADALRDTLGPYGIEIAAAFALPKILHMAAAQPEVFAQCRHIVHQTDWIIGMLCGRYDVTDISTALKTGANPETLAWPEPLFRDLGLPVDIFPEVVLPGTPIGKVTATAAAATGLPAGTPVVAGCTDGTAGCLASGAAAVGDLNVTLGTTLVFKAIAAEPLVDPAGAVYNHRHPAGGYLPGAASSTGGAWVPNFFGNADRDQLGDQAANLLPTPRLAYPLTTTGERFPFARPTAEGFGLQEIADPAERFAAGMEGTALVERLGIERFESLGLRGGPTIYATGGATASDVWLRVRASVMRRTYAVPEQPECAVGAAILAATAFLDDFTRASRMLVRIGRRVEPDMRLAAAYDEKYMEFKAELRQRGYL